MTVLTGTQTAGLVSGAPDNAAARQPNGIDLSVAEVATFAGSGMILSDGTALAQTTNVARHAGGTGWRLSPGAYLITFNERVTLPTDIMAYLRPRSSLLRMGAALHTGVWDAGYSGTGKALLVVYNPHGLSLEKDTRIGQLVCHRLEEATDAYNGSYQNEG